MCIVIIENVQIPVVKIVKFSFYFICQPIYTYNYIWLIFVFFINYVVAWDLDDDWISMCILIVCLIKYYLNMLNLTNIEGNHYKYYTSYYPLFNNL